MAEIRTRRRGPRVDPAREPSHGPKVGVGWGDQTEIRASLAARRGIGGAVDRFYAEALLQSRVWFLASVLAALVGLIVIVWEIVQVTGRPNLEAALKAATGLLVEAVAALFYGQSNATRKHAADLLTSTQSDRDADTACQILSTIQDDECREEIAGRLAMHFAGVPTSQVKRPAGMAIPAAEGASSASDRRRSTSAADWSQEEAESVGTGE